MTPPLLEARGLVKRYGGLVATDNLDFSLALGEVCGVIGPNGAGKSTLVSLLGGALQPSAGSIRFAGLDVTRLAAPERARAGIGRTYQIPRPFLDISVQENLEVAQVALGPTRPRRELQAERQDILRLCGLGDCAGLPARDLPLLRRKRLEVARALALKPKLLLLDEVGAGLVDSEVTELIALIRSVAVPGRSIVIIEHVIRVVKECCSRLVVLNFGKRIAEGRTADVLADDGVAAVYLGTAHGTAAPPTPVAVPMGRLVSAAPARQPGALLELHGVSAGYGQARVLHGLDLAVRPGQVVAVLGTNGAGKTTLAGVIAGSVPATAGRLVLDGEDITALPPHLRAGRGVAHCMEGRRIFARLSVEENLAIAARGVSATDRAARLDQVYGLFPDLRERRLAAGTAMSGGQQQMLAIGRALMSRPRLVIFDEISLGLAPVTMDRLYAALAALRAAGLTMLLIEQDVDRALALADQVHVLERGVFALSGTAADVRADPRLRHLYISGPE
jgi:branched-chain amino acid transport system ATP-binding protein